MKASVTLPKTNMEPEKRTLWDYCPVLKGSISGSMLVECRIFGHYNYTWMLRR